MYAYLYVCMCACVHVCMHFLYFKSLIKEFKNTIKILKKNTSWLFPSPIDVSYPVGEVHKLNTSKNFNIFHSNVNGLENKMDLLHEFLTSTSDFDVIAITETSQRNNEFFKNNVAIKGYNN